jgi:uroporphyrinogen-III decarboxylase
MLAALADYPVHAFNWDAHGQGNLSLAEGRATLAPKAVVGGLPHKGGLVDAEPADLARAVQDTSNAMGAAGWMLGTGCTFPPNTPEENVRAVSIAARGN